MSKSIPVGLVTELARETNAPIELYEIYLESQTYYYANAEQDITLGSQTYTALGIERSKIGTHMGSKVDELSINFDNTDRTISNLLLVGDFQGRRLFVKKVLRGFLSSSANIIPLFDGRIDGINISDQIISVRVVSWLDAITKHYPGRTFQKLCNYKLGDTACDINMAASANLGTGVVSSATATTVLTSSLTEINGYWDNGYLKITSGTNAGYSRPVHIFTAGSPASILLRLPFPEPCDNTSNFEILRGCDKTENDCNDRFANIVNYGGFPTIPRKPLV
jgi:uncharacterized phage protein (TIGR02218 family)